MTREAVNDRTADWTTAIDPGFSRLTVVGTCACAAFLLLAGGWTLLAPLSGAALAAGTIAAAGQNQRVQHLEGGIVQAILVREGERVAAGQSLFELDPTQAQAAQNRLRRLLLGLEARASRLVAERGGDTAIRFDPAITQEADALGQRDVLTEQTNEFEARLRRHQQERLIFQQGITALREQIDGMAVQEVAVASQLAVVRDEAARKRALLDKGLTDRAEYTALLRSEAELLGQQGQAKAAILSARTNIGESQEQLARLETQRVETAVSELNEVRASIADTREQLVAARSVAERTTIRAPAEGIVVKLAFNSVGSVVRPGESLAEILPTSDDLVVEARIAPRDVDIVTIGQPARLRFSALNTRTTPTIDATVTYLSADRLLDADERQSYYLARLSFSRAGSPDFDWQQIYPGMPVEAYIQTGERTFAEYLAKPLIDSMSRAFRE